MIDLIQIIAVIAVMTMLIRFLPFWIFGEKRKTPNMITYLGSLLPYAIIGMLVVYCLKDMNVSAFPFGIPEILGCAIVAILHVWKRNTLISVGVETVSYMLLVQLVF